MKFFGTSGAKLQLFGTSGTKLQFFKNLVGHYSSSSPFEISLFTGDFDWIFEGLPVVEK